MCHFHLLHLVRPDIYGEVPVARGTAIPSDPPLIILGDPNDDDDWDNDDGDSRKRQIWRGSCCERHCMSGKPLL